MILQICISVITIHTMVRSIGCTDCADCMGCSTEDPMDPISCLAPKGCRTETDCGITELEDVFCRFWRTWIIMKIKRRNKEVRKRTRDRN